MKSIDRPKIVRETNKNKIMSSHDGVSGDELFFSLCRTLVRKKRSCLKCRKIFTSVSNGNRVCADCSRFSKGGDILRQSLKVVDYNAL